MSSKHAVEISDVTFSYDRREILSHVDLTIEQGEFVGLIGPNGGGKTTLFRLMLGFLKPDWGSVSLFGMSPQEGRSQVGYVPQGLRYDKQFPITVLELVLMGLLSKNRWWRGYTLAQKKASLQALERVGLADQARTPFCELSGGQAQRALIARALVANPKLLLLDEPTANVDAQAESAIYNVLNELKGSMTILMVTHDFEVALDLVERVVCVQTRVDRLKKEQVCEHFAMGVYHPPVTGLEKKP